MNECKQVYTTQWFNPKDDFPSSRVSHLSLKTKLPRSFATCRNTHQTSQRHFPSQSVVRHIQIVSQLISNCDSGPACLLHTGSQGFRNINQFWQTGALTLCYHFYHVYKVNMKGTYAVNMGTPIYQKCFLI
jgi:hypothetical protein